VGTQFPQCLHKGIGDHVGSRAIDEMKLSFLNNPTDEVKMNVDMFGSGVVLVILHEHNSRLIIRE